MRDLLTARRALGDDGPWVFGSDSRSGHIEEPKFALGQVAKATASAAAEAAGVELSKDGPSPEQVAAMGIVVSSHDLRRTFVTVAEETPNVSIMALKALVNHSLGKDVTSGYVQMTVDRLRRPAQRVCDRMMELCGIAEADAENYLRKFQEIRQKWIMLNSWPSWIGRRTATRGSFAAWPWNASWCGASSNRRRRAAGLGTGSETGSTGGTSTSAATRWSSRSGNTCSTSTRR